MHSQDVISCLGADQRYASHSVDLNNKFQVSADTYGVAVLQAMEQLELVVSVDITIHESAGVGYIEPVRGQAILSAHPVRIENLEQ